MKLQKKGIAALGLAVLMMLLAGCDSQGASEDTTGASTAAASTTAAAETTGTVPQELAEALGTDKKELGATHTSPISNEEYVLKFIDDFNGTQLNSEYWTPYTRNYNQAEEQVNRAENVSVHDGVLDIVAKKEDKVYTGDAESWETPKVSNLTGGAINSLGKVSFQYGRFEIRAKAPYSYGMWPAFWTMGDSKGWPWCGEIDIFEMVGGVDQWNNYRDDEYSVALHYCPPDQASDNYNGMNAEVGKYEIPNSNNTKKLADDWHIYGIEWTETKIVGYFDNQKIGECDITDPNMSYSFHNPHYMILNLVMGGDWAGKNPDESKGTVFPMHFLVDWVKVWQKA